jgi:adenylate kinase family enzyme
VVERIAVVGSPGSGKSTVARAVSVALGIPHLELDSVFHQPGWAELPADEFRDAVRAFTDRDAWVVDGNYTRQGIADLVWPRADTVVWLDLPRSQTMRRVGARTIRRISRGEKLWNDNQERWRNLVDPRPEENILLWTWTRYNKVKQQYARRFDDPQWSDVNRVRLTSSGEVDAFLQAVVSSQ